MGGSGATNVVSGVKPRWRVLRGWGCPVANFERPGAPRATAFLFTIDLAIGLAGAAPQTGQHHLLSRVRAAATADPQREHGMFQACGSGGIDSRRWELGGGCRG